jgi:hypothetical protein
VPLDEGFNRFAQFTLCSETGLIERLALPEAEDDLDLV